MTTDIENPSFDHDLNELLRRYRNKRLFDMLIGPAISFVVHVIVLGAMLVLLTPTTNEVDEEVAVQMIKDEIIELDEIIEIEEILPDEEVEEDEPILEEEIVDLDETTPDDEEEFQAEDTAEMDEAVSEIRVFDGVKTLDGLYGLRTGSSKNSAGKRYGGKYFKQTQQAVMATLAWMEAQQNPNGSWPKGKRYSESMTSLGILAFLANGVGPSHESYGDVLVKAATWLKDQVDPETGLLKAGLNKGSWGESVYQQAIVTYALSEFYGMTKLPMFKPIMDASVSALIKNQKDDGSWSYNYDVKKFSDGSLTGWHAQALKAAYASGCSVEGLQEATNKTTKLYLGNVVSKGDKIGFGYYRASRKHEPRRGIGPVSALCLQLYGEGRSMAVKHAYDRIKKDFLTTKFFIYNNPKLSRSHGGLCYDYYYMNQVVFQYQDMSFWREWNTKFIYGQIYKSQIRNKDETTGKVTGYWLQPGKAQEGKKEKPEHSWETFYSTALNCLTLEVYYRNLPTSKKMSFDKTKNKSASPSSLFGDDEGDDLF